MSRAKVLVVEDDPVAAISLREVLELIGFEVTGIASTVGDALEMAEKLRPDIGIFDVRLAGGRDGIEGARILRDRLGLLVVFLAANADQETRVRASGVQSVACISKPVGSRHLISAVDMALRAA